MLSIQPRLATAAGGMSADELVLEKAKELLDSLPGLLLMSEGTKELFIRN